MPIRNKDAIAMAVPKNTRYFEVFGPPKPPSLDKTQISWSVLKDLIAAASNGVFRV